MNSKNDEKVTLCKMRRPDGTDQVVGIVIPPSIPQSPENVDEFLKTINQGKTFVRLSSSEIVEYALSCHKEVGQLYTKMKSLMESFDGVKKIVFTQDHNQPQKEQKTDSNLNNPYGFEEPLKKIKLEDQSEEIQKLNQVIKDLKEGNLKLQTEIVKLSKANEDVQKQNEETIKNLKEESLKLQQKVLDLKNVHLGSKSGPL